MRKLLLILLLLTIPKLVDAQSASGNNKIVWDQVATTLAVANAYGYNYYPDASTTPIALTGVTCTGTTSPFSCTVPFPAFTPGSHTLTLTAVDKTVTPNLESNKSGPLSFTFVLQPASPGNVRIGN